MESQGHFSWGKKGRDIGWAAKEGKTILVQGLLSEVAKGLQRVHHMLIIWRERAGLIRQMAREMLCPRNETLRVGSNYWINVLVRMNCGAGDNR